MQSRYSYRDLLFKLRLLRDTNESKKMSEVLRSMSFVIGGLVGTDDEISNVALSLSSDILDISHELLIDEIVPEDAYMLTRARIDKFIYVTFNPYMARKYGSFDEESLMLVNKTVGRVHIMGDA